MTLNRSWWCISSNRTSCVWLSALLAASSYGSVAIRPGAQQTGRSTTFQWINTAEVVFQFSSCHLVRFPPTNWQHYVKSLAVPELPRSPEQCLQSWKMRSWISSSVAAADQKTRSGQWTQKQMEDSVGQSVFLKMKCWFAIFKRTKWTCRVESANYS